MVQRTAALVATLLGAPALALPPCKPGQAPPCPGFPHITPGCLPPTPNQTDLYCAGQHGFDATRYECYKIPSLVRIPNR